MKVFQYSDNYTSLQTLFLQLQLTLELSQIQEIISNYSDLLLFFAKYSFLFLEKTKVYESKKNNDSWLPSGQNSRVIDANPSDTTPTNKDSPEKGKSVTIYIDPGHGGDDSGSKIFRRKEKNINLSIAVLVGKILTNNGYNVILSRDSDVNVSLKKRYSDANNTNSELFISIHTNSTNPLKSGYSVIYPNNKADDSFQNNSREENSAILAEKISESLTDIGIRKGPDGVYSDVRGLAVLRGTEMPSVIVEVGYIFTDGKKLSNNTYQERVSSGIANGIQNYLNK